MPLYSNRYVTLCKGHWRLRWEWTLRLSSHRACGYAAARQHDRRFQLIIRQHKHWLLIVEFTPHLEIFLLGRLVIRNNTHPRAQIAWQKVIVSTCMADALYDMSYWLQCHWIVVFHKRIYRMSRSVRCGNIYRSFQWQFWLCFHWCCPWAVLITLGLPRHVSF